MSEFGIGVLDGADADASGTAMGADRCNVGGGIASDCVGRNSTENIYP